MAYFGRSSYSVTTGMFPAFYGGYVNPADGGSAGESLAKAPALVLQELSARYGESLYGVAYYGAYSPLVRDAVSRGTGPHPSESAAVHEDRSSAIVKELLSVPGAAEALAKAVSRGTVADGAGAAEAIVKHPNKPIFEPGPGIYGVSVYGGAVYGGAGVLSVADSVSKAVGVSLDDLSQAADAIAKAAGLAFSDGALSVDALVAVLLLVLHLKERIP